MSPHCNTLCDFYLECWECVRNVGRFLLVVLSSTSSAPSPFCLSLSLDQNVRPFQHGLRIYVLCADVRFDFSLFWCLLCLLVPPSSTITRFLTVCALLVFSHTVEGKTPEQVQAYFDVFWDQGPSMLKDWSKLEDRIQRGEKQLQKMKQIEAILDFKVCVLA